MKGPSREKYYKITEKPVGLGRAVELQHKYPGQIKLRKLKDAPHIGTSRYSVWRLRKKYR